MAIWAALLYLLFFGQSIPFPGPGTAHSAAAPYSGPGDVVSANSLAWWGLRAYSAATAGNKAARVCLALDVSCGDLLTNAVTGNLDLASLGAPDCVMFTCTISTLYDQTGALQCTGSTACDLTQSNESLRPILTPSCQGSLPCITWTASKVLMTAGGTPGSVGVVSISAVGERTGSTSSFADLTSAGGGGDVQFGFTNSTNTALLYAGNIATAAANDNALHAMQALLNGGSSIIYVDGSSSSVSAGGNSAASAALCMGNCNNGLAGISMEVGWWTGDKSTSFSALNANQHAYWGF